MKEETALPDEVQLIINRCVGGKMQDDGELAGLRLVVENDNDPLSENLIPPTNAQNEKCKYNEWGHSGICYQKSIISNTIMPSLKVRHADSYNRVQLFELLFMKDYIQNVITININKNIKRDKVTHGEFLRWLGIWLLIATVIGLSRDAF